MKKILIIALLLWSLPALCQVRSAAITASGLTCSMCSKAIYKSLQKVSFIKSIEADVEKSSFIVHFKEGETVNPDEVKKAVENAGFSVAAMQLSVTLNNVPVENDSHVDISGDTYHFLNVPKQTLQGDKTLTIVDKNYLSAAAHRKYGKYTKMKCFETGMMESCCPNHSQAPKRIYHVTL